MKKPICTKKAPYVLEGENKKKYAWCACGKSSNQPFCDGKHKGTNITPIVFENKKEGNIALCGCKKTGNPPYCDGTHSKK